MIELGAEGRIIDELPLGEDSLVWIVGAFKGKTIDFIAERFNPYFVAFDPQAHAIANLQEVAARNPKVTVVQAGLDAWTSRMKMYAAGSDACTVYRALTDRPDEETEVGAFVDVADMVEEGWAHSLTERVDLAILNCEGGEFKIIPRLAEVGKLGNFTRLLVQFHTAAVPAHIYAETLALLDQTHRRDWEDELPSWGLWTAR